MIKDIYQGSWFPNFFYYICNNYKMSLEDIFVEFVWLDIELFVIGVKFIAKY